MTSTTTLAAAPRLPRSAPAAARAAFALLGRLDHGTLTLQLPDGSSAHFGRPVEGGPRAAMRLANWNACKAALASGDIGFAESFMAGDWTTSDLTALLELFIANREALERAIYGSWWGALAHRLRHALRRNSRRGSARNIPAHYDLGNGFYRLWLDRTMTYSSAWFEGDCSRPLEEAQAAKLRRALREAGVVPGARVLELGCGWGGLAECAAGEFGAHVTGITLSQEQLAHARQRLEAAGLAARCDLRLQDYRDLPRAAEAPYDAVVSIEMFEAIGREYWGGYFATLKHRLAPGGRACVQSITLRDDLFERYLRSTDFIQQYVFPGGLLPSRSAFTEVAERAGLRVVQAFAFGADYAETLRRWRLRFLAEAPAVRGLGFDLRFLRLWEFYLAYCEAAFARGNTDVVQFTLEHA